MSGKRKPKLMTHAERQRLIHAPLPISMRQHKGMSHAGSRIHQDVPVKGQRVWKNIPWDEELVITKREDD